MVTKTPTILLLFIFPSSRLLSQHKSAVQIVCTRSICMLQNFYIITIQVIFINRVVCMNNIQEMIESVSISKAI